MYMQLQSYSVESVAQQCNPRIPLLSSGMWDCWKRCLLILLMPVENRDGLLTRNCCSFVDKMVKLEQKLKALEGGSQSSRVVHPQESVFRLPLGDTEENRTIYRPFTMNTDSQVFWERVHMRKQSIQGRFLFYHTAWEWSYVYTAIVVPLLTC